MNCYECPCCRALIATTTLLVLRDCPTCKATTETQRIVQERAALHGERVS